MPPEKTHKLSSFKRATNWYARYERPISSLSLVAGFVFDTLTLRRVDMLWENVWVAAHFLLVGICIILLSRQENKALEAEDPARLHFWFLSTLQFTFGGLLSTFIVFYFRSATLSVSWPFLLIMFGAFLGNERLKRHYARLSFQISFFFLCLFSFAIFIVPVILHQVGPIIFLTSGAASLFVLGLFFKALKYFALENFLRSRKVIFFLISLIFIGINILYFFNLIPPIPLSLKDAHIYHSLSRNTNGDYVVEYEDSGWFGFFNLYEDFHAMTGETVYAYSAIFSPASLNTNIIHEWQRYDEKTDRWITANRVKLPVFGGRGGGYRTYSLKNAPATGRWRVNVLTLRGEVIGRLRFNIIPTETKFALTTGINY